MGFDWLPKVKSPNSDDPRSAITLRHALNMSSGLYNVDSRRMEYATGSGLAYWAGAGIANGALNRGLIRKPGTYWDYENYDNILGVLAMKKAVGGNTQTWMEFPRKTLLDKIGMRNTFLSTDRFGDFVLSSQVYTMPEIWLVLVCCICKMGFGMANLCSLKTGLNLCALLPRQLPKSVTFMAVNGGWCQIIEPMCQKMPILQQVIGVNM